MARALPHLLHRMRRAWQMHWLRGRRAQLLQGITTLEACIAHDQALVAHMRNELRVIDARCRAADPVLFRSPL